MTHSLIEYSDMRAELCSLAKLGKLDSLKHYKEIKILLELYSIKGQNCDYMLGICKVISGNKELMDLINEQK